MNRKLSGPILLVEDDPCEVELTLAVLNQQLFTGEVEVVRNGVEALDYLYRRGKFASRPARHPVVVLLDNKMPCVNGLEVLKTMKGDEQLKMIPVVALTSSREAPDLAAFYQHGVNAYVVKPLEFSEFAEAVKQIFTFWVRINEPPVVVRRASLGEAADSARPAALE